MLVVLGAFGLASCSGGQSVATFEPVTDPAQLFLSLTLDRHAINLTAASATASMLQLTATPRNGAGEPMLGLPAPTFRSSDTTAVQVSTTGLVTALREATGVTVIAEIVTPGNVRRADTAVANVTSTEPPALASLSIDPVPPDSAVWTIRGGRGLGPGTFVLFTFGTQLFPLFSSILKPHPLDATETEIPGVVVEYASLDPAVATVDRWTGQVTPLQPGSVRMVAQTTVSGITKVDTTTFTVTLPVGADVVIYRTPNGAVAMGPLKDPTFAEVASEYRIAPHGYVVWSNLLNVTVNVTFEDLAHVAEVPAATCDLLSTFFEGAFFGPGPHCGPGDVILPPPSIPDCPGGYDPCVANTVQVRQFPVPGVYRFSIGGTDLTGRIVVSDEGRAGAAGP